MIAKLRGVVDALGDEGAVVDVGGVGYLVACSARTLGRLQVGGAAQVLVETWVREDAIQLFGFVDAGERDWFRLLTTVQGVGAKVALALLSALSPDQLIAAIATADKAMLTRTPGVGPKLAIRICTELREKAGGMPGGGGVVLAANLTVMRGNVADALSALTNLGYRRAEAEAALARAADEHGEAAALDVLIRAGLKALAK